MNAYIICSLKKFHNLIIFLKAMIFKVIAFWVFYITLEGKKASIIPTTNAASIAPNQETFILGTKN